MARSRKRPPEQLFAALDVAQHKATDARIRQLLHELQVHAEELTAQNEQLKRTQAELEQARSRYADLYDFAPIGFLTLSKAGVIMDINVAGAALLGHQRSFMEGLPLAAVVDAAERRQVRRLLANCWIKPHRPCTFELTTKAPHGRILRFTCRPQVLGRALRLFTAVIDVTDERRLESERAAALEREQSRGEELTAEARVRQQAEERVRALLERLVSVQEEERRRIARNLHDQLGQQMTALRLTIDALKEKTPEDEFRRRLDLLDRLAAQIDRDVDYIARDLRPAALDDVGLNAALAALVREWSAAQGIAAEFHVSDPDAIRLVGEIESHLYRIVQEALNNVAKHAAATRASVLVERRGEDVAVIIEDDGRGFDVDRVAESKEPNRGMGLAGMHERASLVGGSVQVESAPGHGTTVFVRLPVRAAVPPRPKA